MKVWLVYALHLYFAFFYMFELFHDDEYDGNVF